MFDGDRGPGAMVKSERNEIVVAYALMAPFIAGTT